MPNRLRVEELKDQGICVRCCGRKAEKAKTKCIICLEEGRAYARAERQERRKKSLCIICGKVKRIKGLCDYCKSKSRIRCKKRYYKNQDKMIQRSKDYRKQQRSNETFLTKTQPE